MESFVLFCAGEDSGDNLGASFVEAVLERGILAKGIGGPLMQAKGLQVIENFDVMPVSGFWDILPNFLKLKKIYKKIETLLLKKECIALVAIDYPGFNMKLVSLAKKIGKKVLYIAPPQIWAWKKNRGKKLRNINLAVLFDFEKKIYLDFGCQVELLKHPVLQHQIRLESSAENEKQDKEKTLFLLPGSRLNQAKRNLKLYLKIAEQWKIQNKKGKIVLLASRKEIQHEIEFELQKIKNKVPLSVVSSPKEIKDKISLLRTASVAISPPGTITIELSLLSIPFVVVTKPDFLTYYLGSFLLHLKYLAMPNLLLNQLVVKEYVNLIKFDIKEIARELNQLKKESAKELKAKLENRMTEGRLPKEFIQNLF